MTVFPAVCVGKIYNFWSKRANLLSRMLSKKMPIAMTTAMPNRFNRWRPHTGDRSCRSKRIKRAQLSLAIDRNVAQISDGTAPNAGNTGGRCAHSGLPNAGVGHPRRAMAQGPAAQRPARARQVNLAARRSQIHERKWCPWPNSNGHVSRQTILSRSRLPFRHRGTSTWTWGCLSDSSPDAQVSP